MLEKKKIEKKHSSLDASARKERFRTVGGPPPAAVLDDPIAQNVRRFDPLPNPYDGNADSHDTHTFLVSCLRNLARAVNF